ncbi:MAG TPA: Type 1 glutamine amidotransferase-like domain-containing protein, partial [Mycobacterium sp.]|nr:Type 1 glutamine amidotransferase-like domain-containing protein [Mycobacterium sp.]
FYEIFEAAMDALGIADRRMVGSSFDPDDRAFLDHARLIVLAGGDVRLGWDTFEKTGMKDVILDRYAKGAVLVGVSAGAIQLGRYGIVETPQAEETELLDVFDLVPLVIDAHDERAEWARIAREIQRLRGSACGLGIPSGGGVIAHTDGTIEALRHPAHRFVYEDNRVVRSTLPPLIIE